MDSNILTMIVVRICISCNNILFDFVFGRCLLHSSSIFFNFGCTGEVVKLRRRRKKNKADGNSSGMSSGMLKRKLSDEQDRRARWKSKKLEEEYSKLKTQHDSTVLEKCKLESEVGKRINSIVLPIKLLHQFKPSDFQSQRIIGIQILHSTEKALSPFNKKKSHYLLSDLKVSKEKLE
ncbi:hypothetical protein L2E82_49659 [Cichorium intybus]|uniref:Uncharacterized protein n=1 Tax=Cichorium intybus TaxID=13427 RepID=A0ACB8Z1T8_CICIN|nr:hypothetical protein L2E82_49659 [Cichorium intybus]